MPKVNVNGVDLWYRFSGEGDVTARPGDVTAPTLVMVGSEDVLTPLDAGPGGAGARHVAENLPDARLVVFEGSGHGHYIEQPDESLAAIIEFLSE